jgi:HAD superfamily phosphatase
MNGLPENPQSEETEGYERINQKVWLRTEQAPMIAHIDCVIFDIDGVIIDVSNSFRVAISQTVQLYCVRTAGFTGDEVLLLPSETQLFKLAGGFNNDWDLSAAAILFYLTKAEIQNTKDTRALKSHGQTLEEFTAAAGRAGGGMHGAMAVLFPMLTKEQRLKVESEYNRDEIERLFQELYGGTDHCDRLYGHTPVFNKRKGLLNAEKTMLDPAMPGFFPGMTGVLTGRTKEETEVGLEKAGLAKIFNKENVYFDSGLEPEKRKPRPGALIELAAKLGGKVTLYVGDVMDDLLVVRNANLDPAAPCLFMSAMIASPTRRADAALFRREHADIVSLDVNEALRSVISRRQ